MDVRDHGAVITAGHTGMGFATAKLLAQKGARVTILGRRVELARQRAAEIGAMGIGCDIGDADSVDAALDEAERAHGPTRILVNSAAIGTLYPLLNEDGSPTQLSRIRAQYQTNVMGTLIMDRAVASRLTRAEPIAGGQRGVLINISSIAAADGRSSTSYAASKGAVDAIALSLARELDPWGIRVCTIAPGSIMTEMFLDGATPERFEMVENTTPGLRRVGRPEEIAALALHICENEYLNGVYIRLDGGRRINIGRG